MNDKHRNFNDETCEVCDKERGKVREEGGGASDNNCTLQIYLGSKAVW